jgi:transcriptional regulator with XRE-family HTH domain
MNIGKAIKLCRIQKEITQKELTQRANISISYLSLLERNKRKVSLETIQTLAEALETNLLLLIFQALDPVELEDLDPILIQKLVHSVFQEKHNGGPNE